MPSAFSHSELGKEVPGLENSGHPDQNKCEANPKGFDLAVAEETEQRVGYKNDPSDRGEQNQYEKVVRITFNHEVHIEHRTGNQEAAYDSTRECKTSESSVFLVTLWSWIHQLSLARSLHSLEYTESFVVTSLDRIKLPRCGRTHAKALGPFWRPFREEKKPTYFLPERPPSCFYAI